MIGISSVLVDDGLDPKMQELVSNKEEHDKLCHSGVVF
jgi:hypothetical protein